ncbi:DegT/DnrJ/EryC1/StrS family aminotransferase [Shouchella patagoniensis]|uniref:DegT/DnrJ/EryC1/StrS family aminotransferase n=1 Tax=Shouchella patagoniensis TaxID=228576 RepID=UPI000995CE4C|nr:aminotransferase class I/II-fold pyridoxal phosphate-dependent enzyme [Shouchella patagoniensis]
MKERIHLSLAHLGNEELTYVNEAFETNWVAPLGPNVDSFEKELSNYINVNYATAVSSGTAAIHLGLQLLGVRKDDIVFCSSLTFVASANPILYQGAEPVFIDSDPITWNMSTRALEKAFEEAKKSGKLPKAVIVVNLYGQSADYDPILEICNLYNVPVLEDAAESLGATYKGRKSGTLGKLGVFSFNGNKIITTSGGGMLVSDDQEIIDRAKFLATQARENELHYQHNEVGYNYRLSNVLAGIGRGQLKVLEDRVSGRRAIYSKYYDELNEFAGIEFMPEASYGKHNRWLTTLTINSSFSIIDSSGLIKALHQENIEARPVWKPLHLQPLFKDNKYYTHEESVSEILFRDGLCLPSSTTMTLSQQERVIDAIKYALKGRY